MFGLPVYIEKIIISIVILLAAFVVYRIGVAILRQFLKKWFNAMSVFYPTVKGFWKGIVFVIAVSTFFKYVVAVSTANVLTALGVGGATIAIACQAFVKDMIMGFLILAGNNFQIGDTITVKNSIKGKVDKISLQYTRLIDENGNKHYISNSELTMVTVASK